MASKATAKVADAQRAQHHRAVETQALTHGAEVLAADGPEAAVKVLESYATVLARLAPLDRTDG